MKRIYILAGIILALSLTAFGQKQKTEPEDVKSGPNSSANGKNSKNSKNSGNGGGDVGSLISAGTNLEAELQSVIDVRKSNVGDQVVLKTTKAIKQNGEVVVPKGTKLIGRITEVKRKTKDDATSKVGMVFDRIQGRELDIPVNVSLVAVTAARATAAGDLFSSDLSGSGSASGSASASRPASSGGLLGGGGGLLGGVTSTAGSVVNTTASTVGNVTGSAVNTVSGTTGTVGRTVNGLRISQSASGSANSSSTISAIGKDVKIEKGASFLLRLDGSANVQE